ncbi:hypothetical protein [uncultured Allofournierella sp.]|uniref:hypothetical protein n=1 Tax=uncultured Allofournierella sp. TaxID=1940258 RepID=UPI0025F2118E|nr:hypothetical protein [uncultured Fournierella sp.]
MLTQEDMQALAGLINTAVTASEERMKSYMEDSINTAIAASEERMKSYMEDSINTAIAASEERMTQKINEAVTASEERMKNHMNVVVESQVMPMIRQVADGVVQANERLDRLEKKVDDLEATVAAHEVWIVHKAQND